MAEVQHYSDNSPSLKNNTERESSMSIEAQFYHDNDFSKYAGMWVAILGKKVIAHGRELSTVAKKARKIASKHERKMPLFVDVPNDDMEFI